MKKRGFMVILFLMAVSCGRYLEESVKSPELDEEGVTFRFRSRSARVVQVAGDWNNWARGDAESGEVLVGLMKRKEKEDIWEITVQFSPGRYRYYFIINESSMVLDPENPRITENPGGGKANLLIMP
ncbi:MAG: glycogen-binding domain-containing protein [Candidatus Krumholzibacteriota bacterium]|nr:glycogen-binding domain-containing protein [Candidatus Krumholzibacteriota bacterium]